MEQPDITEISIGPDKVLIAGDRVIIYAAQAMTEWTVREFRRPPIFFRDKKYYLIRKTPGPSPYAFIYELEPWPSEFEPESTRVITYDEFYVAERDGDLKTSRRHDLIHVALLPFYPLLGLCWSGFKERVLGPIGFEPAATTAASILVCFSIFLLEGIFVFYMHLGFLGLIFSSERLFRLDWFLLLLLPLDCMIRYGQVLRSAESPDGFLEWAFGWLKPKNRDK